MDGNLTMDGIGLGLLPGDLDPHMLGKAAKIFHQHKQRPTQQVGVQEIGEEYNSQLGLAGQEILSPMMLRHQDQVSFHQSATLATSKKFALMF